MAELLKYIYNDSFFKTYADALEEVLPSFDRRRFMEAFGTPHWASLELKQRMAYLTHITQKWLPTGLQHKVAAILELIRLLRARGIRNQNLEYIFLADIITESGIDDPKTSFAAIEQVTSFTSFEFAGRAFFVRYPVEMMQQMLAWTHHPDPNVRRYASEGCRPRLPWGQQLRHLVKDPSPIIPVLEQLKEDPSDYVLTSVANNLNDISKDHPVLVKDLIRKWSGKSSRTDKMLKKAARTLLKNGDEETLGLFGHHRHAAYQVTGLTISKDKPAIGESLSFEFTLANTGDTTSAYRVEYGIWFMKSNGNQSRKIFKIAERTLAPGQKVYWNKTHRLADLTTRKHYAGPHQLSILVNGSEAAVSGFNLIMKKTDAFAPTNL